MRQGAYHSFDEMKVIEVLEGDRYTLEALNSNRTHKYAHDRLGKGVNSRGKP